MERVKALLNVRNLISLGGVALSLALPRILFREEFEEIEVVETDDFEPEEIEKKVEESK